MRKINYLNVGWFCTVEFHSILALKQITALLLPAETTCFTVEANQIIETMEQKEDLRTLWKDP